MSATTGSRPTDEFGPRYVDGRFVPSRAVPFSEALDQLIAQIRAGQAPNLGRFCAYCCAPLTRDLRRCSTCGTAVADAPPRDKISRALARLYTAKRKREARFVHGAAWLGLIIGTLITLGLIIVLPSWTKFLAVVFLIVGSYFIATYLANVVVQDYAYRNGLAFFAEGWRGYLAERELGALNDD